jgi:hypothetical protein
VTQGLSIVRAAAALNRNIKSVRIQARKLGAPFPPMRVFRKKFADAPSVPMNIFAASSSYKDGSGVMGDGSEARANLQEKLEQARRLLQEVSDLTTIEGLKKFIADLENRLRNTDPK